MKDRELFECFASPAFVDAKCVHLGVKESTALKRKAVFRGMTEASGAVRKDLSWREEMVALMREATTGEPFDHEWWAGEISKPEWVKRLDEHYGASWLYFPSTPAELTSNALGAKVGYDLTLNERRLTSAAFNVEFIRKWEAIELEKARRRIEPEFQKKVRVVLSGFDSWQEYVSEAASNVFALRGALISLAGTHGTADDLAQFIHAFDSGLKRATEDFQSDPLSEFNERAEVVEILGNHWSQIAELRNRAEITVLVAGHLSPARREFLKDDFQSRRFTDRMREIYRKIGLPPATAGRPRKIGEEDESK